jgi:hypothetical protein
MDNARIGHLIQALAVCLEVAFFATEYAPIVLYALPLIWSILRLVSLLGVLLLLRVLLLRLVLILLRLVPSRLVLCGIGILALLLLLLLLVLMLLLMLLRLLSGFHCVCYCFRD